MNPIVKKLLESRDYADSFFSSIYDEAHEGRDAEYFQRNPREIVDTFKQFIFHDDNFQDLKHEVQEAIRACIPLLCKPY